MAPPQLIPRGFGISFVDFVRNNNLLRSCVSRIAIERVVGLVERFDHGELVFHASDDRYCPFPEGPLVYCLGGMVFCFRRDSLSQLAFRRLSGATSAQQRNVP